MELPSINNLRNQNPWILGLIASGVLGGAAIVYLQPNTTSKQVAVEAAPVTAVVALGRIEPEGEVIKLSVPNAQDSRVNQIWDQPLPPKCLLKLIHLLLRRTINTC